MKVEPEEIQEISDIFSEIQSYTKFVLMAQDKKRKFIRKYGVEPNTFFLDEEVLKIMKSANPHIYNDVKPMLLGLKIREAKVAAYISVGLVVE